MDGWFHWTAWELYLRVGGFLFESSLGVNRYFFRSPTRCWASSTDTIPNDDISGDCTPKPSLALDENQGMLSKGPYNLRSRVPVGAKCGEYEGSLGPNPSKEGKGLGRGKRSNLSLAQERTTIEVVEGKKSLSTGILRAFTTPSPFPCDYRVRPSHKNIGLQETYTKCIILTSFYYKRLRVMGKKWFIIWKS